jgi:hypothetical protein
MVSTRRYEDEVTTRKVMEIHEAGQGLLILDQGRSRSMPMRSRIHPRHVNGGSVHHLF